MLSLIFDDILLLPKQSINIHDIESYLYNKSNIPMKISIKPFDDYHKKFGESNVDIKEFKKKYENKCLNKLKDFAKDLDNDLKVITKNHFQDKFKYINKKLENFPYNYLNPNNLNDKDLPEKKYFDNILTMKNISDKEYKNVKLFYKKMKFKNLREYVECYSTSDITLLADVFNNFRK